jgi:hypothetical protein
MTNHSKDATSSNPGPPLPDALEIQPARQVSGRIRPPGSKSITNRALVISALAEGRSTLTGVLDSEDTAVMIESWRRLGVGITHDAANSRVAVTGCAGRIPAASADLHLANSGTSMRFLTAAAALGRGTFRLDGVPRMRERPIEELAPTRSASWARDVRRSWCGRPACAAAPCAWLAARAASLSVPCSWPRHAPPVRSSSNWSVNSSPNRSCA